MTGKTNRPGGNHGVKRGPGKNPRKDRTSITLTPTQKAWLIWQAAEQKTTVTALVVQAVQQMMEEQEQKAG